jgi:hypothetical protein
MPVTSGKTTTNTSSSSPGSRGSATGPGGMFGGGNSKGSTPSNTSKRTSGPSSSLSAPSRTAPSTGKSPGSSVSKTPQATSKAAPKANPAPKPSPKPSTGSKAPNAAAAAASAKLRSKAPVNAAAKVASDKLNAAPAPKPRSIQGLINNPVSLSARGDDGLYAQFRSELPQQNTPSTFSKTITRSPFVNRYHVPTETWSKAYNPNKLTPGAQKIHQSIVDAGLRRNTPVDFFSGASPRASGTPQHPRGEAIDVRFRNPMDGSFVGSETIGAARASNPIGNINLRMGRTPEVAKKIQGALEGPYRDFARDVLGSFYNNPGVYGDFSNQRWGGSFGGAWGKDYMHFDEGRSSSGVNADQAQLRREASNLAAPTPSLRGGDAPVTQIASGPPVSQAPAVAARPSAVPMPRPRPLPESTYSGYGNFTPPVAPPPPKRPAPVPMPTPRPPAQAPQAPPVLSPQPEVSETTPPGYFQQFAMTPADIDRMKQEAMRDFSFGELMEMRKNQDMLPGFMGPFNRDQPPAAPPLPAAQVARPPMGPQQGPVRPGDPTRMQPIPPPSGMGLVSPPPGLAQNYYDTMRSPPQYAGFGVGNVPTKPIQGRIPPTPGAPDAWVKDQARITPENISGVETYIDPSTGIARNFFDTQRGIPGAGMSFTPGLPGPQKQFYDRLAETPGPQQPWSKPAYPGATAAGTYTTPYDVRPKPFRNGASEGLPPGYSDRYFSTPEAPAPSPEFSENHVQGPSNPSQEQEDQQAVQQRREKYRNRGAMIGSVVLGPVGGLIGGLLGDQMGKTKRAQREAIASNPQALRANVASINSLSDQYGQRNPDMRVSEPGLQMVLTNPNAVLSSPQQYTTLEQMLAALAAGIDPETGKPI